MALVRGAPCIDLFDWAQPPRVVDASGELREPRTQSVRDPVERPEANFGWILHRVLPAVRLLEADTEDPDDRLVPHRRAKLLAALSIRPRRHQPVARLVISHQRRRELAYLHHVERATPASAGVRDDTRIGIDLAHLRVPKPPKREEPLLPPEDIRSPRGILRRAPARQVESCRLPKILLTILTVALARTVPPID